MLKKKIYFCVLMAFWIHISDAQPRGGGEAYPNLKSPEKAVSDFMDLRFGLFLHWGPVTLRGEEIGWSRGKQIPIQEYDQLYKEFNPVLFDADAWVKTAKDAGMKYLVFTAKHHDGFCMWPSEYTIYDIESTPYKKDILLALKNACDKYGIKFGIYYSIIDWKHEHYVTRYEKGSKSASEPNMSIYVTYMKNQLKELIDTYDPFLIWYDGVWEEGFTHEMGMDLYAYVRSLKNDIVMNDRVDKGMSWWEGLFGKKRKTPEEAKKYAGDYSTPEQKIGNFHIEYPWETCMTIAKQWAWKPNDKIKSLKESIHTLLKTVGSGGNLLYNVGPMPDGRFELRQIELLEAMGAWLEVNGEAVYNTIGGPYMPNNYMVCTRKDNKLYISLLKLPKTKTIKLPFPKNLKLEKAYYLHNKEQVKVVMDNGNIRIEPPKELYKNLATVIVLEVNKPTEEIEVIQRFAY